jgi:hypothetical protein
MTHQQQHISNSRQRIEAKSTRATQELEEARLELRALQRTCKHDGGSKFIPDASGNNECLLCGGEC